MMMEISEAFVSLKLGIAARKYGLLHQGHQIKSRLDGRRLTSMCIDCFEMDSTGRKDRPIVFTFVHKHDLWLLKRFEVGQVDK